MCDTAPHLRSAASRAAPSHACVSAGRVPMRRHTSSPCGPTKDSSRLPELSLQTTNGWAQGAAASPLRQPHALLLTWAEHRCPAAAHGVGTGLSRHPAAASAHSSPPAARHDLFCTALHAACTVACVARLFSPQQESFFRAPCAPRNGTCSLTDHAFGPGLHRECSSGTVRGQTQQPRRRRPPCAHASCWSGAACTAWRVQEHRYLMALQSSGL